MKNTKGLIVDSLSPKCQITNLEINHSLQHFLKVYPLETERPKSFEDVDSILRPRCLSRAGKNLKDRSLWKILPEQAICSLLSPPLSRPVPITGINILLESCPLFQVSVNSVAPHPFRFITSFPTHYFFPHIIGNKKSTLFQHCYFLDTRCNHSVTIK